MTEPVTTTSPTDPAPVPTPAGVPASRRPSAPVGLRLLVALVVVEILLTLYQAAADLVTALLSKLAEEGGPSLPVAVASAALAVVVATLLVVAARGLAHGRRWALVLALVLVVVRAVSDLVRVTAGPSGGTLAVVDLVVLGLLGVGLTAGWALGWFSPRQDVG
jgi:hypothetical protein